MSQLHTVRRALLEEVIRGSCAWSTLHSCGGRGAAKVYFSLWPSRPFTFKIPQIWPRGEGSLKNNSHSPDLARQTKGIKVCLSLFWISQRTNQLILDLAEKTQLVLGLAEHHNCWCWISQRRFICWFWVSQKQKQLILVCAENNSTHVRSRSEQINWCLISQK